MTRLTLYWHLRNIVEGVPECESYPVEEDEFGVTEWGYSPDYASTGTGPYAKKNGCVNVFYDRHLASHALNSPDGVAYLDSVAHDPCVPIDWRTDAEELLSHHIMERRLICSEEKRGIMNCKNPEMRNSFSKAQIDHELPKKSMQSNFWSAVSCPNCNEGECLFDVDNPKEPNHCLGCGTKIQIPKYPK